MSSTRQNVLDPYAKFSKDLKILKSIDLLQIEENSMTMTLEECLALFLIIPDELTSREAEICKLAVRKGQARGIKKASEKLFSNMSDSKQGIQACLSYLKRFSDEFKKEVDDSEGSGDIVYNVNIQAEPKEKQESSMADKKKGSVRSIR